MTAKIRWKILAKAIVANSDKSLSISNQEGEGDSSDIDNVSVRRFSSFGLFSTQKLEDGGLEYQIKLENTPNSLELVIRHPSSFRKSTRPDALIGFNNTGNVCVWPSEEALASYCLDHKDEFADKSVCEIGSGYSALAALVLGAVVKAEMIVATDGNEESVRDIAQLNIDSNKSIFKTEQISSSVLRWEKDAVSKANLKGVFDIVICADCLFFEECHQELCSTLYDLLNDSGKIISFAPTRGETLDNFCKIAESTFEITRIENYNESITAQVEKYEQEQSHSEELLKQEATTNSLTAANKWFDRNLHFPVLLILRKKSI